MKPDEPKNHGHSSFFDLKVGPSQNKSYLAHAKCNQGYPCVSLCISQHCQADAALCLDQQCKCKKNHNTRKICSIGRLQKIISMTEEQIQSLPDVQELVNKKYDWLIDWISQERERVLQQMSSFGLNQDQRSFLKTVYEGECSKLTGKQMSKIVNDANLEPMNLEKNSAQIQEQLSKLWEGCVEKVQNEVVSINSLITKTCLEGGLEVRTDFEELKPSKVLVTETERAIVAEMLEEGNNKRKISKIELLYRASDNYFDVSKFWQKCNHKADTVTVARTEFDKVIGGYTPLSWKKEKHKSYEEDSSLQSFVFSVTESTKFALKESQKQHAIYHVRNYGPVFGNGHDFNVNHHAHYNNSRGSVGCAYENRNVPFNTNETFQFFLGHSNNSLFLTKEWEVWQVTFD